MNHGMCGVLSLSSMCLFVAMTSCNGVIGEAVPSKELQRNGSADPGPDTRGVSASPSATPSGTSGVGAAAGPHVGKPALRRLTPREYRTTVSALVAADAASAVSFPSDGRQDGYTNNQDVLTVSPALAEQYARSASSLAAMVTASDPNATCAGKQERACAAAFLDSFGKRAFRRPLQPTEADDYLTMYDTERAASDHPTAIGMLAETLLQSPYFLYRFELGPTLSPYELATSLSYDITGEMPDDELFAKAADGTLAEQAVVAAQARRLLALSNTNLQAFFLEWLEVDDLSSVHKDASAYPTYDDALAQSMLTETTMFVADNLSRATGFRELLTAPFTFVDARLAELYQVPSPGAGFARVTLDPARRGGILQQASFLAKHAKPSESFPISRGKFVRMKLLCTDLPPPPQNVKIVPPAPDPSLTTRERFARHSQDPACRSCHGLIDPPGFAFESFDGIGRYRTEENGRPVDASGTLTSTADADGPFRDGSEFIGRVAQSPGVHACFARQLFRYVVGRREQDSDQPTLDLASSAFEAKSLDIRELLFALVTDEATRTRVE